MAKATKRKQTQRGRSGMTHRELTALPLVIGALATGPARAQGGTAVDNASLTDLQQALTRLALAAAAAVQSRQRHPSGALISKSILPAVSRGRSILKASCCWV